MPTGSNLKALWADPKWRAQRIADLRENRDWIERRAAKLGSEGLEKAIKRRRRKATARNHDLVRQNAIMLWEYQRMLAAYRAMKKEAAQARDEIDAVRSEFGLSGDLAWLYSERFGLTGQQARLLCVLISREFLTGEQLNFAARRSHDPGQNQIEGIGKVVLSKLRQKLARHGIEIKTIWGQGVTMTAENKARVRIVAPGPYVKSAVKLEG